MTAVAPSPRTTAHADEQAHRLTRWSLAMIPIFVVVFIVTDVVGTFVVLPLLGLSEGDLFLFAHNAAGWVAEILLFLIGVLAPVAGVVLGVKALRRGGRAGAVAGLVVNAGLALVVCYMLFDAIRMAYWPG